MVESRTAKSLKNSVVALLFYFINLGFQFFSRKIFLEHLGAEVLGLNTTATNLLQFLNLAELGVGAAIGYSLYKPLAEKNRQQINEIVSVQGYLYYKIGLFVGGIAVLLMCFFPWIFSKAEVPAWYTYTTFIVLLIAALSGYFFNYKQIVLTSDQKNYKLNYVVQGIKNIKVVLQILAINYLSDGYVWWLGLEFVAAIVTIFGINAVVRKEYPWLHTDYRQGKNLIHKYSHITRKTKQLFFHKIASFVVSQSSPIVVYAFTSLTVVAIYGNYMLIVSGCIALLNAVFNSISAGIGNLVAECDTQKTARVFYELFSVRFFLISIMSFGVYIIATPFIVLWVGVEYLLPNSILLLITLIMFFNALRTSVESFLIAHGMFQDVWYPLFEAFLNIGLSVLLGLYYGLNGILSGILISLIGTITWKPYFLFRIVLKLSLWRYILVFIKHISAMFVAACISMYCISLMSFDPQQSFADLLLYMIVAISVFTGLVCLFLYLIAPEFKMFINRISNINRNFCR